MLTLRAAGFRPGDSVAAVAQRTGQPVSDVLQQTGLRGASDVLADRALDAPFKFPDGFAMGRAGTKADRPTAGASSTTSNSGAGGLLRMQLNASFDKKATAQSAGNSAGNDVSSWGLPTDRKTFPHDGAFMGAFLGGMTKPGRVDTMERAEELAERLGARAYVAGDDVQSLTFSLYSHLQAQTGDASAVARKLTDALQAPFKAAVPKAGTPLPDRIDVSKVPTDVKAFPHQGAFMGAFVRALAQPGIIDSPRRADELTQRLGMGTKVARNDDVKQHLFSLVQTMFAHSGPERAAQEIVRKLDGG